MAAVVEEEGVPGPRISDEARELAADVGARGLLLSRRGRVGVGEDADGGANVVEAEAVNEGRKGFCWIRVWRGGRGGAWGSVARGRCSPEPAGMGGGGDEESWGEEPEWSGPRNKCRWSGLWGESIFRMRERERESGGMGVDRAGVLSSSVGSYLRYCYLLSSSAGFIPPATTIACPGGMVEITLVAAWVYTPRYYYQLSSSAVFMALATTN